MAISVTACSPARIFTAGQLITLTGAGFQMPFPLPNPDGPIPTPPPTVSVLINGKPARNVTVLSPTSLTCIAPPGAPGDKGAPGPAPLVVTNLDSTGAPTGDTTTATNLLAYYRADLTVPDNLQWVTRTLIQTLSQQVVENVVLTMSTDYSSDAGKLEFDLVDIGSLPCVTLAGPIPKRNKFYGTMRPVEQRGSAYVRRRYMRTSDLVFKVGIYDNNTQRILNIQALLTEVLELNTYFEVQADPNDASKGSVFYELDADDIGWASTPNTSDVRAMAGELTIRGFNFEDVAGFPDSQVVEQGAQVTETVLTSRAHAST